MASPSSLPQRPNNRTSMKCFCENQWQMLCDGLRNLVFYRQFIRVLLLIHNSLCSWRYFSRVVVLAVEPKMSGKYLREKHSPAIHLLILLKPRNTPVSQIFLIAQTVPSATLSRFIIVFIFHHSADPKHFSEHLPKKLSGEGFW